jgi:hypothetical protein
MDEPDYEVTIEGDMVRSVFFVIRFVISVSTLCGSGQGLY